MTSQSHSHNKCFLLSDALGSLCLFALSHFNNQNREWATSHIHHHFEISHAQKVSWIKTHQSLIANWGFPHFQIFSSDSMSSWWYLSISIELQSVCHIWVLPSTSSVFFAPVTSTYDFDWEDMTADKIKMEKMWWWIGLVTKLSYFDHQKMNSNKQW